MQHQQLLLKMGYSSETSQLYAGINFLRPADMFFGRGGLVLNERREKIETARADRKLLTKEDRTNFH